MNKDKIIEDRKFTLLFHTTADISLGISISFLQPNIEIHLPFWFIKIGWDGIYTNPRIFYKSFGIYRKK
jgi:hypothetical protein